MPGFDVGSGLGRRGFDRVNEAAPPAADALRFEPCFFTVFFVVGDDPSFLQNLVFR